MDVRLVPTTMNLNGLERRNSLYFAFLSPNSIALQADYLAVVEDVPKILSPSSIRPLLSKTNAPCDS